MANKFQKGLEARSSMEVIQKQAEERKRRKATIESVDVPSKESPAPDTPVVATTTSPVIPDLSQFIEKKNKREAKSKAFYLDMEVIEAIQKASKDAGIAESKLVNDIMKKVLGIN